jgi:tetratricopeptide (TPR) repeat protein
MADSSFSKRDRLRWAALLVAACLVTYANGLTGAFTYDDKAIIRDNPRIRSPRDIGQIFTTSYFGGPRGTGSAYRPMLLLSYAAQWWIHGSEVAAFHFANILFHAGATLLLAGLLWRIGLSPPTVAAASLLFAVHPIHVEAVTSLVGRGETQAAVFVLLYLHGAVDVFERRRRWPLLLAGALLGYAGSILTKESGAVAPGLALLLFAFLADGTLLQRLRAALLRGLPLWILSAIVLAGVLRLRAWVLGGALRSSAGGIFEVENVLAPLAPGARMTNACVIFLRYLGRCIFPLHLSGDESAWSIRPLPAVSAPTVAATLLLLALLLASLIRLRSRSPLALGFLFFGVAFLPSGNLLFPIGTVFAERIAYLPSAGACLILGSVVVGAARDSSALSAGPRRALAAVALLFSMRAIARNTVWWTDEGLFTNLIATAPGSAKAHYDLAYSAANKHRHRQARAEYERAIAIYGRYWDAWAGKGRIEKEMGLLAEAEQSYARSIAVNPDYENGYFGLGQVREARGDVAGAEQAYRRGLARIRGSLPLAYHAALVSGRLGRASAAADWRRALTLGGNLCSARSDYARWLWRQGRSEEAARQAFGALRRDPACVGALELLAEHAERSGHRLARALALEKAYLATKSPEDLAALERLAREYPAYARRFAALKVTVGK